MVRRSPSPLSATLVAIAMGVLLAACSSGGPGATFSTSTTPAPGASTGSSAAPPCPAAPEIGTPAGWGAPAVAPPILPIIVSSEQVCGENRFMFSFLDSSNRVLAAPDAAASVAFYDLGRDATKPVGSATGTFVWGIQGVRGIYVVHVTFPESGTWGAEFTFTPAGGTPTVLRTGFTVEPKGVVVAVGDRAPGSVNPTLADVGGDPTRIATDPSPDPAFYAETVAAALAAHEPIVVVFATPKFCTSAQCGPTLDRVKAVAADYPTVRFINIEPYKLILKAGTLQADLDANGQLQPVQASRDWGLVSEPWIFVVDKTGIVRASLEGIVGDAELRAAIDAVK